MVPISQGNYCTGAQVVSDQSHELVRESWVTWSPRISLGITPGFQSLSLSGAAPDWFLLSTLLVSC